MKIYSYCNVQKKEKVSYFTKNSASRYIIFGILLLPFAAYAQSSISRDCTAFIIGHSPAFSIYKDNYFISGTQLGHRPTKDNSDAKFQFSFKQRIQNKPLIWGSYFYLTYTQKSFWDIYKSSSPFAESNYNPGLQLVKPLFKDGYLKSVVSFSIEHESNGKDSIDSRSWNFIAVNYAHFFSDRVTGSIKLFLPFGTGDNPDLSKYVGYAEAQLSWNIKKDRLILDVMGRKGASWDSRGSLMSTLSFRPSSKRNLYWTLQWWQGYSESLIDYRQSRSMLRIGFMVKPTFFRFY